jgi:hypothetical protein
MAQIAKRLIGDTVKVTWINSGSSPSAISAAIYNGSDTLVNSQSMTNSGDGHYYALYTLPNTPGFYVAETIATLSGNPYKNRINLKAVTGEAD